MTVEQKEVIEEANFRPRKSKRVATLTKAERMQNNVGKDQGIAILKYARISSSKVKIVIDLIKGKPLNVANGILKNTPKAASELLIKLVKSAEANAVNNNGLDSENLYVADAYAGQGPTLKRIRPRAQGRAFKINKRTSHITVVLKEFNN